MALPGMRKPNNIISTMHSFKGCCGCIREVRAGFEVTLVRVWTMHHRIITRIIMKMLSAGIHICVGYDLCLLVHGVKIGEGDSSLINTPSLQLLDSITFTKVSVR